ncbi:MAG: putative GntR-family transcriptional regulator [Pseudonocardiales bacterium]|nr:putative GntR-family transcriptional regulator [Jatrophihabitantaceae bacterium]MCW2603163.1 putative GntR-family transcriptional regulator [Pseudonocardiales bacterium]
MRLKREKGKGAHSSPRRAYEQLRAGIRVGALDPRQRLVDDGLADVLGASRNSVRRALQMLAEDGLITRERGTGTTLCRPIFEVPAGEMLPRNAGSTAESAGPDGPVAFVEELRNEVAACPADVRERLGVEARTIFIYEQLVLLSGEPAYVRIGYIPRTRDSEDLVDRIEELDKDLQSFDANFARVFGVPFGGSRTTVEALPCSRRIAHLLGIEEGSPVLLRELTLLDAFGQIREISYTHFRGDRIALSADGRASIGRRAQAS